MDKTRGKKCRKRGKKNNYKVLLSSSKSLSEKLNAKLAFQIAIKSFMHSSANELLLLQTIIHKMLTYISHITNYFIKSQVCHASI